jgi:hypothetical protein
MRCCAVIKLRPLPRGAVGGGLYQQPPGGGAQRPPRHHRVVANCIDTNAREVAR